ncbi:MAG: SDR family oxidoreductase [Planctomycetota bacterium]
MTGATGYVGGRLVPRLLERGYRVRCFARSPRKLEDRSWASNERVEFVQCDLESDDVAAHLRGCRAAYYLVHSMMAVDGDFARRDRVLATRFAEAALEARLDRMIYLGGLGETGDDLSDHLRSRRDVEAALSSTDVPLTTLRAAIIIGSGSVSFAILRYLVEHLPVMITPRWVLTECQPIAIRDVLHYLVESLECEETVGRTLDIGGPEVLRYRDLLRTMAKARGLKKRLMIPVPLLTPRLSSYWIQLVTPIGNRIARPLAEGLRNRVVARNDDAARLMPKRLLTVRESIDAAIERIDTQSVETSWSDAGRIEGDPDWAGGTVFEDTTTVRIDAPAKSVYRAVCRVGGGHGWYALDWLWHVRGMLDVLVGGPGLRRGRRDPENVTYGEALDFWRVVGIERDRRLDLRAEMKVPGDAELHFVIDEHTGGRSCSLTQRALFRPKGLLGLAYWYAVLPLHGFVFSGMTAGIRRAAEADKKQMIEDDGLASPATPERSPAGSAEAPSKDTTASR